MEKLKMNHITKIFRLEDGSYCRFDNLKLHKVFREIIQESATEGKRMTWNDLISEVSIATSVSESSINHWLKGHNAPSDLSKLEGVADFLQRDLFEIVNKEEPSEGGKNMNLSNNVAGFAGGFNCSDEKSVIREIYRSMVDYIEEFRKTVAFENDVFTEEDRYEMRSENVGVDMYNQILIKIRKAMFDIPYEVYQKLFSFANDYLYFFTGDEIIPIWYLSTTTEEDIERLKGEGIDVQKLSSYMTQFVGYATYSKEYEGDEWEKRVEYVNLVADKAYVIIREILNDYLVK